MAANGQRNLIDRRTEHTWRRVHHRLIMGGALFAKEDRTKHGGMGLYSDALRVIDEEREREKEN